jgi:hypothetical protein
MGGFLRFLWLAAQSQPVTTIFGAAMVVAGVSYQEWLTTVASEPPWFLMNRLVQLAVIALGTLIVAYVFFRQAEERRGESPQMRRLRLQPYSTFREISEAISGSDPAWSKNEVLHRLITAVWQREFESYSGHSRMRITFYDEAGNPENARPIVRAGEVLGQALSSHMERALYEAVAQRPSGFSPGFVNSQIEPLTIERADFMRWYRRFRNGRYEL